MLKKYAIYASIGFNIYTPIWSVIETNHTIKTGPSVQLASEKIVQQRLIDAGFKNFCIKTGLIHKLYCKPLTPEAVVATVRFSCAINSIHSEDLGMQKKIIDETNAIKKQKLLTIILQDDPEALAKLKWAGLHS